MSIQADDRTALIPRLQQAVQTYYDDLEAGNLAVLRLLRGAGATWSDLLQVPGEAGAIALDVMRCGNAGIAGLSPAACGHGVLLLAAWTIPYMLACAAVMAHAAPHSRAFAVDHLQTLALDILQLREDDQHG